MTDTSNFAQFILQRNNNNNDIAYSDSYKKISYKELASRSRRFVEWLNQNNIKPRTRIIINLPDGVDWMIAYYGCLLHGCTIILTHPDSTFDDLKSLIERTKADVIIKNSKVIQSLGIIEITKYVFENLPTDECKQFYYYLPDESAVWFTTSGTTGLPKIVMHRHQALFDYLKLLSDSYNIDSSSRVFVTPKPSFSYGFCVSCITCPALGAHVIINDQPITANSVFQGVNSNLATHLFTNPTILNLLVKKGNGKFNKNLAVVISASEPLPLIIQEKFLEKYSVTILDSLGFTESLGICITNTVAENRIGSIGKPCPGYQLKVVDENNNRLGPDQAGILMVNGPTVSMGYYQNWNATKNTYQGHWMATNDVVKYDQDGFFYFLNRDDQYIKINAYQVCASEIENILMNRDDILDCSVIFETNDHGLIETTAFVKIDPEHTTSSLKIRSELLQKHAAHLIPKNFYKVQDLPRTVTNKRVKSTQIFKELKNVVKL